MTYIEESTIPTPPSQTFGMWLTKSLVVYRIVHPPVISHLRPRESGVRLPARELLFYNGVQSFWVHFWTSLLLLSSRVHLVWSTHSGWYVGLCHHGGEGIAGNCILTLPLLYALRCIMVGGNDVTHQLQHWRLCSGMVSFNTPPLGNHDVYRKRFWQLSFVVSTWWKRPY